MTWESGLLAEANSTINLRMSAVKCCTLSCETLQARDVSLKLVPDRDDRCDVATVPGTLLVQTGLQSVLVRQVLGLESQDLLDIKGD